MPQGRANIRWTMSAMGLLALALAGCTTTQIKDRLGFQKHLPIDPATGQPEAMAMAEEHYRQEQFEKSEDIFSQIAEDTRQRPEVAEKARFYQAESLRKQGHYPRAVDAYHRLLQDFPSGLYRAQASSQMYAIAAEWLKPVLDEMAGGPAEDKGKKSWSEGIVPVNFDRKMPTFMSEDRALQALDQVYFSDPTGPTADKALYLLGRVHFHRKNYVESARYLQQLVETSDRSPYRDDALKLAIVAKTNTNISPDRDGRDTTEAMRLINTARATSPQLSRDNSGLLDEQTVKVRSQQAARDYETAEFYRRTGHPGSAWFYYELVKRRYPGIKPWSEMAANRQLELKAETDELQADTGMWGSTRRFWKQYILGHEIPTSKPELPEMKELPERRERPGTAEVVPADGRQR